MHHKQVDSSTSELTDRAMSWNESGSCKLSDNSSWQDFVDGILNWKYKCIIKLSKKSSVFG